MKKRTLPSVLLLLLSITITYAQPAERLVKVIVAPDRTDWTYQPGNYSWGFNDETCPPTSMYAAYNTITASKSLFLALDTGHWTYPEQRDKMMDWLLARLKGGKNDE